MKKSRLSLLVTLPLLLVATGCNKPNSILANALNELKNGVKVDVICKETYGDKENTYYLTNTSKSKEFSYILYKDSNKEEELLHEYIIAKEGDDKIYQTRLNINNEYNTYRLLNPLTSEFYVWEDGYDNVFKLFKESDFTKVGDFKYSLKLSENYFASKYLSTLLYSNPGLQMTSFEICLKDNGVKFFANAEFKSSITYTYSFEGVVTQKGIDTEMDYRLAPFENVSDPMFEKIVSDLQGHNYTATIINEEDFDEAVSMYYSNPDKIYYESILDSYGYYVTDDNKIQGVLNVGGKFYKSGQPIEGNIKEVMPSFDFKRAAFDKDENVYTPKDGVEGDIFAFCVLECVTDYLGDFTITVLDDGYKLINDCGDRITTIIFSDIGTTDVGFTKDTVLVKEDGFKWNEILEDYEYEWISNIVGEEVAALIPVPNGYTTWFQFSEESDYAMLVSPINDTIDQDIVNYKNQLLSAGFTISSDTGINGGNLAELNHNINGKDELVIVEYLEYEGFFTILIYLA